MGEHLGKTGCYDRGCRRQPCRDAKAAYMRDNRHAPPRTVPPDPIRALVPDMETARGVWSRYYAEDADRAVANLFGPGKIKVGTADRWCLALGVHLSALYPEQYPETFDDEELTA